MRRALIMLPLLFVLFAPAPGHAVSYCDGYAYVTRGAELLRFDPETGDTALVRELPVSVNALAAQNGELYAIARPGGRAVRVSADGTIVEIGRLAGLGGAYVAAAHDGSWLLLHDGLIHRVDLDRLVGTHRVPLRGEIQTGDWAADRDGRLLTLSTLGPRATLITIDPRTGRMDTLAQPSGLPGDSLFGAVWLHANNLYAWHNSTESIYAVDLARPASARLVRADIPAGSLDAAACEPTPAPASPSPTPLASLASSAPLASLASLASLPPPPPSPAPAASVTMDTFVPRLAVPPLRQPSLSQPARSVPPPSRTAAPGTPMPAAALRRGIAPAAEQKEEEPPHRHIAVAAGVLTLALLLSLRGHGARNGR